MSQQFTSNIPVGDLQLYDKYVPALDAGNWSIEVGHTLAGVDTGPLGARQTFVVSAPQFSFDTTVIVNQYPPEGSTGPYAQVLPHIVLKEALLPWERKIQGSPNRQPWLALLLVEEDELIGGAGSPTRCQVTTVEAFLRNDINILKPTVVREDDVTDSDVCTFIQISTAQFSSLMPRLEELRFLAHCRQSNIADKAEQGLEQNGLFSVVAANRFPAAPAANATIPLKSIAHLVSVEGLEAYLVDQPDFAGKTSVALVSLASWTFQTLPGLQQDFRGLMEAIVSQEFDGTTYHPSNLWLRVPDPSPPIDTRTAAGAEATRRIRDGFAPLAYQTRTGEQTFAWFRGPLAPVLTTPLDKTAPFLTADSCLIYQSAFGTFDASLAAAWELGRALALSDRAFSQTLFDFRRRAHRLTDSLLQRLQSDAFTPTQIATLSLDTTVQNEFMKILDGDLLRDIGLVRAPAHSAPPRTANPPDADPKTAVQNFLTDPAAQQKIIELVSDDLAPIATWLARLLLLYPVPFNVLVPDSRMLAPETLRFFYVDSNWLGAMLDGALSIGLESSRETFFYTITHGLIHRTAFESAQNWRSKLLGVDPPTAQVTENLISGFLLRSAVVSGWPNLAIRPGTNEGTYLKTLRMDHLSPGVLLCLFWGVPDFVEISEPQEGFRFGVDDDGMIPLRQPVSGTPPLGTELGKPLQVLPAFLRSATTRVLNLSPTSSTGSVQGIQAALRAAGVTVSDFGPSDFSLQMIKSPEAIRFSTQSP